MSSNAALAELLQFYVDIGVDEVMGDTPPDRIKPAAVLPASDPPAAVAVLPALAPPPSPAVPPPVMGTIEALREVRELVAGIHTLEELRAALENFQGLAIRRTATQMVFADDVPAARIMLVGEAPGADEDRIGRPFVGASGQLLDKMLAAIGLSRDTNVYITNIVNWRPPGNRTPTDAEIALSLPFVRRHIELINPAVLVYVGGVASKALLQNNRGITSVRGKWIDYVSEGLKQPVPSMALFHPSYLLRSPGQKKLAWEDLQMLQARLRELGIVAAA